MPKSFLSQAILRNPWELPFWALEDRPIDRTKKKLQPKNPLLRPSCSSSYKDKEHLPLRKTQESDGHYSPRDKAYACADQASSRAELLRAVENFEGCALKDEARSTVFSDGNPEAPIMLLGEAPGAEEDRLGKPFVGRSGQLLDRMFEALGWTRDKHFYISNTTYWRPPQNRDPLPQELEACAPFVEKHIALIQPKILVTVGSIATKFILKNQTGIMRVRGQWYEYKNAWMPSCVPVRPLYHPAYLLRSPSQKRWAWEDLQAIKTWADEHQIFES